MHILRRAILGRNLSLRRRYTRKLRRPAETGGLVTERLLCDDRSFKEERETSKRHPPPLSNARYMEITRRKVHS